MILLLVPDVPTDAMTRRPSSADIPLQVLLAGAVLSVHVIPSRDVMKLVLPADADMNSVIGA
jgi:hypothetical protein